MKRDIISGIVVAALGLLVTRQAAMLTYRDEFGPGPGLLPYWLGLILCALALIQVGLAFRRGRAAAVSTASNKSRVLLAVTALVVMTGAVPVIGFIPSFGLLSFFLVYAVEKRSLPRAAAVAVAMMLGFVLLFRMFLPVPLP